jgi:hypothetical protein
MRKLPLLIASLLLLAGCSNEEIDGALSLERKAPQEQMAPPSSATTAPAAIVPQPGQTPQAVTSAPQVAQSPNAAFCRSVATQDATTHSFDAPTQQRVFTQRYNECLALHGN